MYAGIVLVDPVTLGCGHAFSRAALLEHLNRLQVHRTCPLCRWEVPADFELKVDPLLAYVLARYVLWCDNSSSASYASRT